MVVTGLLLLVACSGSGGPGEPQTPAPTLELPPPLAETRAADDRGPSSPVDPDRWLLPDPAGDPDHPPWFRLFWSQENQAELEACGCPGSPTGGMARRATLAGELRSTLSDVMIVEGPSALSRAMLGFGTIEGEHRARGRLVLESLAASAPDAFFPGHADFAVMAPKELAAAARGYGIPLVATNLDAPGFQRSLLREVDGRRVLLLGLVREPGTTDGLLVAPTTDPVAAATAVAAAGPVDLVVALTDGDRRSVRQWREAGLDVDVLLTPPEPSDDRFLLWDGTTLMVRADPLGRAFRRLDVAFTGGAGRGLWPSERPIRPVERVASLEGQYVRQRRRHRGLLAHDGSADPRKFEVGSDGVSRLDPSTDPDTLQESLAELASMRREALSAALILPVGHAVHVSKVVMEPTIEQDPAVRARIEAVAARRLRDLQASAVPRESVPEEARYVGRTACVGCHSTESAHWSQSPHAHAWKTLLERGETENPDCLRCHTTGFAAAGGFADPAGERALLNVECEACHGPMAKHVEEAARRGFAPSAGRPISEVTCLRCHDPANSPRFDYSTYLPRVMHEEPR